MARDKRKAITVIPYRGDRGDLYRRHQDRGFSGSYYGQGTIAKRGRKMAVKISPESCKDNHVDMKAGRTIKA